MALSTGEIVSQPKHVSQSQLAQPLAMLRVAKFAPRRYGVASSCPRRHFAADMKPGILSSDPAFLPGSQCPAAPKSAGVPLGPISASRISPATPATPSSSTIPPQNVPLTPPPPTKVQTAPPTSSSTISGPSNPPPSTTASPPPPKKPFRPLRTLVYAILFGGLAYGGAVFYALQSDNFHDSFTEYVPFGEESVLYFEERSFRNRFPNARHHTYRTTPPVKGTDEPRGTIPSRAGLSWKVQEKPEQGSDLTQKGRHMSALDANKPSTTDAKNAQQDPKNAT
jgi:MICOS complex subunit MIC60